ncbi:hypothetical protein TNIN_79201 [Trichonephila inaurata madagascariensis]|uniref:Uncharacterized protein n=1 Tax=Trichonephila inaurata madagascariensis TaxID=2747483 RepID=A0A8X6YBV2_9ARAC|nr:hypothetical protein TNIN_79201 [Trichonephila inaurata madagascariensis]
MAMSQTNLSAFSPHPDPTSETLELFPAETMKNRPRLLTSPLFLTSQPIRSLPYNFSHRKELFNSGLPLEGAINSQIGEGGSALIHIPMKSIETRTLFLFCLFTGTHTEKKRSTTNSSS